MGSIPLHSYGRLAAGNFHTVRRQVGRSTRIWSYGGVETRCEWLHSVLVVVQRSSD